MRVAPMKTLAAILCLCFSTSALAQPQPHKYVMDSLNPFASREVKKLRYEALKNLGVEGITMDIWWGVVEPEEGKFNWDIYKENFKLAKEAGLKVIPIEPGHSEERQPLPGWIWNKFKDMKFKDSEGVENREFISYFVPEAHELRKKVLQSFKENFYEYDSIIPMIYIGLGPSGEARYPSFSSYWNYPAVGRHQAGSDRAISNFQKYARDQFGIIEKLNGALGLKLQSFEELTPPTDGLRFFKDGVNSAYGRFFMDWYQGVLDSSVDQDQRNANEVLKTGENPFHGVLAGKIAGIYWLATDKVFSHGAERAAGYYNYDRLMKVFAKNNFELTFTAFEMDNKDYYPDFSRAADLVREIAELGKKNNVRISGENADAFDLSYRSWAAIENAYRNINRVFENNDITAFTFLRADFLVNDDGSLRPEAALYRQHLGDASQTVKVEEEEEALLGMPELKGCNEKLGETGRHRPPVHN